MYKKNPIQPSDMQYATFCQRKLWPQAFLLKKKTKQKRTRQTLIPQLKVKLKTEIKF